MRETHRVLSSHRAPSLANSYAISSVLSTSAFAPGVFAATFKTRAHESITISACSCVAVRTALLTPNDLTRLRRHQIGAARVFSRLSDDGGARRASASTSLNVSMHVEYMALRGRLPAPVMSSSMAFSSASSNTASGAAARPVAICVPRVYADMTTATKDACASGVSVGPVCFIASSAALKKLTNLTAARGDDSIPP